MNELTSPISCLCCMFLCSMKVTERVSKEQSIRCEDAYSESIIYISLICIALNNKLALKQKTGKKSRPRERGHLCTLFTDSMVLREISLVFRMWFCNSQCTSETTLLDGDFSQYGGGFSCTCDLFLSAYLLVNFVIVSM